MLSLSEVTLSRGEKRLLHDATVSVHAGWKVGLVGPNGSGKTSLLALVCGELTAERGRCALPPDWTIAQVSQEEVDADKPALRHVLEGDPELVRTLDELEHAEASDDGVRQAHAHEHLERIDGYRARARASTILNGLGFAPGQEMRRASELSGGYRMRLALARALMCRSDLLLLDEPTNHLDLDAVLWLEGWLQGYAGALLLISHDRDFLDRIAQRILSIEGQGLRLYTGDYTRFEETRAARLAHEQAVHARQQREVAHIHRFVERFRAKASKARQVQSRLKALEAMERIVPAHVDSPFRLRLPAPRRLPRPAVRLEAAQASYGQRPVLSGVSLELGPGDRLGLLGANGAGKSTLVRLIAGELAPEAGARIASPHLVVGYFAQHRMERLRPDESALAHLRALDPDATEQALRDRLGAFGFGGDDALRPTRLLSGGEKSRLALALVVHERPNVLLLDEPTNHLDLGMRHALSLALQDFEGALVLVSHDRHLLRTNADRLLVVAGGRVEPFDGDLDDYASWLGGRTPQAVEAGAQRPAHSAAARAGKRRAGAERRRRSQPLRDGLLALESEIAALHERRAALEQRLADTSLYAQSADRSAERQTAAAEHRATLAAIRTAEERWLALGARLEQDGDS